MFFEHAQSLEDRACEHVCMFCLRVVCTSMVLGWRYDMVRAKGFCQGLHNIIVLC